MKHRFVWWLLRQLFPQLPRQLPPEHSIVLHVIRNPIAPTSQLHHYGVLMRLAAVDTILARCLGWQPPSGPH